MSFSEKSIKFAVTGLMVSYQFQQCQYIVNALHRYYPEKFAEPQIRPMLNVDWEEYLLNVRRRYGGKGLWKLRVPVTVFKDGEFFGDNEVLVNYVTESYTINLNEDFAEMGEKQLIKHFEKMNSIGRNFVYLLLAINGNIIGTLVVMLYSDLVPKTCKLFLNRCRRNVFAHVTVSLVRIVPNSWLQFKALEPSELYSMPCENYAVPHDRRGVLSLYKLTNNRLSTTEFLITLDQTPWMNHHFVAFGQVIQGEETLRILEKAPVEHEVPTQTIEIVSTDRLVISKQCPLDTYIRPKTESVTYSDREGNDDVISIADSKQLREGLYCLPNDLMSYLPFLHLPDYLLAYLKNNTPQTEEEEEEAKEPLQEKILSSESLNDNFSLPCITRASVDRSKGFLVRSKEDIIAHMSGNELNNLDQ